VSEGAKSVQPASKSPAKKPQKDGMFKKFAKYLRDTRSEVKKVVWPDRQQIVNNSIIVIISIGIIGAIIGMLDFGFAQGLRLLLNMISGMQG